MSELLARSARKELEALPDTALSRVARELDALPANPRPRRCKKLRGASDLWRVRVGDYRIIYHVDDRARLLKAEEGRIEPRFRWTLNWDKSQGSEEPRFVDDAVA